MITKLVILAQMRVSADCRQNVAYKRRSAAAGVDGGGQPWTSLDTLTSLGFRQRGRCPAKSRLGLIDAGASSRQCPGLARARRRFLVRLLNDYDTISRPEGWRP